MTLIASNSAGSDTINKTIDVTAIRDLAFLGAKIYPNPFNEIIHFDFKKFNGTPDEIVLYNIHGVKLERILNNSSKREIIWNSAQIKPGMLFYRIFVNDEVFQGRILKN